MATKLSAADIAISSGCDMVIANGNDFHNIGRICDGEKIGTLFLADRKDEFYVLNKLEHMV